MFEPALFIVIIIKSQNIFVIVWCIENENDWKLKMSLNSSKHFENSIMYREYEYKQPMKMSCIYIIRSFVLELYQKPRSILRKNSSFPYQRNKNK